MQAFFLLLEVFLYGFGIYIFYKKRELAIIYLPVIFFIFSVITPILPVPAFYGFVTLLLLYIIKKQYSLFRENPFSILLFIYFIVLLTQASDTIKLGLVYSVLLYFVSLPLISQVYKEYTRGVVFKELTNSALMILVIFILNVIAATATRYSLSLYGINSGILYGNLHATGLNVIGIALFVVLFNILKKNNIYVIITYVVSMAFIMLTMRRSAMLVSALGLPFVIFSSVSQKAVKKVAAFAFITVFLGIGVYLNTDFASVFQERYEHRNLDERALEEEKRFIEYELLYHDMFVAKDYSPWFGYELFNSENNYGKGIFVDRSLHADLTSIAHSSGILGVILYILMTMTAFYKTLKASRTKVDLYIVGYCFAVFLIYTITGRFTQAETMLLLFLVANLSIACLEEEASEVDTEVDTSGGVVSESMLVKH